MNKLKSFIKNTPTPVVGLIIMMVVALVMFLILTFPKVLIPLVAAGALFSICCLIAHTFKREIKDE